MTKRTNQGGSIVTFILVGVVLLAGLGAGVYYLSNDSSFMQDAKEVATETVDESEEATNESTPEQDQNPDANETKPEENEAIESPDASVENKNESEEAPDTNAPVADTTDDNDGAAESEGPDELATTGRQVPAEMPQTGSAENLLGFAGLAVLSFTIMAYIRSMRTSVVE